MAILQGDITLHTSKVMLDVPEGGGGPTAEVVPDGVSNAVFPDISEMDRVNGRVNLRQLHAAVETDDTDTYLGANVVVADPPEDPNVSITLFSTGNPFDTRSQAVARMEAYLNVGGAYQGYLYGNHIAGQATIMILQRSDTVVATGETLVLTKREGFPDEFIQYVRVTEASLVTQTFTDMQGDFVRNVMTVQLSDVLREDFPGFDALRLELPADAMRARTKISNAVVANAARYYGVVALVEDASIGQFRVKAQSVFTQLVPSAQIETPLADMRSNVAALGMASTGSPITIGRALNTTAGVPTDVALDGPIYPGSVVFSTDFGQVHKDAGTPGLLVRNLDNSVSGTVDYELGILHFYGSSWGTGPFNATINYVPSVTTTTIAQSQGFEVTQSNRSLNYIRTIEPPPVLGSLSVSFRAQGKWYVLQDDGTGALRGTDTSIGAGTVNFVTGTVMTTFGAMPDVDTMVIYQWVQPDSERQASEIMVADRKFEWTVNSDGSTTSSAGSKNFTPGYFQLSWTDGANTRTITDDGEGRITGYGTGTINYGEGTARVSPTTLPAPGTPVNLVADTYARIEGTAAVNTVGSQKQFQLPNAPIREHSVLLQIPLQRTTVYQGGPIRPFGDPKTYPVIDLNGRLILFAGDARIDIGGIDYATGNCVINISTALTTAQARVESMFDNLYELRSPVMLGLRSA